MPWQRSDYLALVREDEVKAVEEKEGEKKKEGGCVGRDERIEEEVKKSFFGGRQ